MSLETYFFYGFLPSLLENTRVAYGMLKYAITAFSHVFSYVLLTVFLIFVTKCCITLGVDTLLLNSDD
jgi:hypothetical protein